MSENTESIKLSEYQGKPVLVLDADQKWPFSFGLGKAKILIKPGHMEAIRKFVASNGASID